MPTLGPQKGKKKRAGGQFLPLKTDLFAAKKLEQNWRKIFLQKVIFCGKKSPKKLAFTQWGKKDGVRVHTIQHFCRP
jgi:hypothetical protein